MENFIKKNNKFNNEFKIIKEEKEKNDINILSESSILEDTNNKLNICNEEKIYNEIKKRFTFWIFIEKDKIIKLIKDKKFDLEKSIDYFKEIKKLFEKFDEEFSILSNFSGDDFFCSLNCLAIFNAFILSSSIDVNFDELYDENDLFIFKFLF